MSNDLILQQVTRIADSLEKLTMGIQLPPVATPPVATPPVAPAIVTHQDLNTLAMEKFTAAGNDDTAIRALLQAYNVTGIQALTAEQLEPFHKALVAL